ncbi:MAG: lysophospholipid acyltransferase family protein [Candidatus Nealsonbacteria bacterium]
MNRLVSWFCKIFIAPIVKLLFIKRVKGWENIPKTNFILASNHESHLDWIIDGYICVPRRFHFIGQTDQYGGLIKLSLYVMYFLAGVIRLNRKSKESKKKMFEEAIKSLKMGDCLIIYPEGTRTRTGRIGKGRYGVARMVLESGKPILPMAIKGTFELLPPKSRPKANKIKRIVEINIGKPLYFNNEYEKAKSLDNDSEQYKLLLSEITSKMMDKIIFLRSELDSGK